ncbi:beta-galactosidase-like [Teleopsis dalmanni]|nr:beta-galactosidase-like [Teleopsis dalmanni]
MFFGGTNFGFTAGANDWGYGKYTPDITSYDYDAVMDEAGGITEKYELVRNVIKEYMEVPDINVTMASRIAYGSVILKPIATVLSGMGRSTLTRGKAITAEKPQTFEELDLYSGLVLYETELPRLEIDPTLLTVNDLRDRAFVYVDEQFVGTLSRENQIFSLPLSKGWGNKLQLLVENQGRINFNVANDTKGIMGDITVQRLSGEKQKLVNWVSTAMPLDGDQILDIINKHKSIDMTDDVLNIKSHVMSNGPVVYYGEFLVGKLGDTYLNTTGWGKGVLYVNGFNLGRYWPQAGPQITMYVPKELLTLGLNSVVMLEYQLANQKIPNIASVELMSKAQLDG